MGLADLSIAETAADFELVEAVLGLGDRLSITNKIPLTQLALENAKAISAIIAQKQRVDINLQVDIPKVTTATGNCEETIST